MASILMVPLQLDALWLTREQLVVQATADFSLLPYFDGARDVNAATANVSDEILSRPFQDLNLPLKAGVHLHWALPDALTRGAAGAGETRFPCVPNRWLITRSSAAAGAPAIERQWVVESDYLYPDGQGGQAGSVSVPFPPDPAQGAYRPFRYQGRAMPLDAWQPAGAGAQYLDELTALGYGEPTFAAFYPNSHSVFGFYDGDNVARLPAGLQYDLIGWYGSSGQDELSSFLASFSAGYQSEQGAPPDNAALLAAIQQRFGWTTTLEQGAEFPSQTLCYARLSFGVSDGPPPESPALTAGDSVVAVGNSGVEALSAYLAQRIDPAQKPMVEAMLEGIQMLQRLQDSTLDLGPAFEAMLHEQGFTALPGGTLWSIRQESANSEPADAPADDEQPSLPLELAAALNGLNSLQRGYDKALELLESLRQQLFADWHKYMVSVYPPDGSHDDYPDVDELRHFIQSKDLEPLQAASAATGALLLRSDAAGGVLQASAGDSAPSSLAASLAAAINALLDQLEGVNAGPPPLADPYELKITAAPRYWQPNEPVVLISGAAAEPSDRHGQDGQLDEQGLLRCQTLAGASVQQLIPASIGTILAAIDALAAQGGQQPGIEIWSSQPWNPILLQWEVELFPLADNNNFDPNSARYHPDFITSNYTLGQEQFDLSVIGGQDVLDRVVSIYSGSSILTPHAAQQLRGQIARLLASAPPELELAIYQQALEILDDPGFHALSQALGGFNQALLMRRQTLQLPIDDPLGFASYRAFSQAVAAAVQDANSSAPEPLLDFNPIRTGTMKLLRLRLVDSFGRYLTLNTRQVIASEPMTTPGSPYLVWLQPRVIQPARLNLRWLAAADEQAEMNMHPASSPICGWLVPNNLDHSLLIYDADGQTLGLVDQRPCWESDPGGDQIAVAQIANPHLREMVQYLLDRDSAFLLSFIDTLDQALANIDPETTAQHQDLALIMGRPVALVRAALSLELRGLPAIHQGWNNLRMDLRRNTRDDDDFTQVSFPVRLGEYQQLNDGLVGYWRESGPSSYQDNIFYAPQSGSSGNALIVTHADGPVSIAQTPGGAEQRLSMLVDPRGLVHATAGIVPVKAISIPPDQYVPAMQRLNVLFLSTPILSDLSSIRLPLPDEPGFLWSWLERSGNQWREVTSAGMVRQQLFLTAFPQQGQALWDDMLAKGWITTIDADSAWVTPVDQRPQPSLEPSLSSLEPAANMLLAQSAIQPALTRAAFTEGQALREGWLKLTNAEVKHEA